MKRIPYVRSDRKLHCLRVENAIRGLVRAVRSLRFDWFCRSYAPDSNSFGRSDSTAQLIGRRRNGETVSLDQTDGNVLEMLSSVPASGRVRAAICNNLLSASNRALKYADRIQRKRVAMSLDALHELHLDRIPMKGLRCKLAACAFDSALQWLHIVADI